MYNAYGGIKMSENKWSPELTELTRETINDLINGYFMGAKCHVKRKRDERNQYGYIINDVMLTSKSQLDELLVHETRSDGEWKYKTVDELIDDGWAVD